MLMVIERDPGSLEVQLEQLQDDPSSLPWCQRRELARSLRMVLQSESPETAIELARVLANDPKWEVRKVIAGLLLDLPSGHLESVAACLVADPNAHVCKAAKRALERRRRNGQTNKRKLDTLAVIAADIDTLEKQYGTAAARMARRLAERLYAQFVGGTIHNMRAVLTPVQGGAAAIQRDLDRGSTDPGTQRAQTQRILDGVAKLQKSFDDLREWSRPVSKHRRRERLVDIVNEAKQRVTESRASPGCEPQHTRFEVSVPKRMTVDVARDTLVTALANLLENSCQAFPPDLSRVSVARITVTAELLEGDRVQIVVADNGIGMCREDLCDVRAFSPGRTTLKPDGSGFGLPSAKRCIEQHGGELWIDSQEDVGTQVTIHLPLEAPDQEEL